MTKTVEVDETEFLNSKKLRDTVATIMAHPKAKLLVQQAHKMVDPNAVTPDLDAQAPIDEKISPVAKELAELKEQLAADRAEREKQAKLSKLQSDIDAGFAKLRQAGWTDEGIAGVKKLMDEKGYIDPEDAAVIFEKHNPPPPPAIPAGRLMPREYVNPQGDADDFLKAMLASKGESESAFDKKVADTLMEMRGTTRR